MTNKTVTGLYIIAFAVGAADHHRGIRRDDDCFRAHIGFNLLCLPDSCVLFTFSLALS